MKILLILNEAPYGGERTYNGLRLGLSLAKSERAEVKVFLMGDGVTAAQRGQKGAAGYYNLQTMIVEVIQHNGLVLVCGSCIDARGLAEGNLVEGVARSSMEKLTQWTLEADKVIAF